MVEEQVLSKVQINAEFGYDADSETHALKLVIMGIKTREEARLLMNDIAGEVARRFNAVAIGVGKTAEEANENAGMAFKTDGLN